jgi:hypothetical protein
MGGRAPRQQRVLVSVGLSLGVPDLAAAWIEGGHFNHRPTKLAMPDTVDDVDEHPIIFNDWSINRILAGEKTQTRRIVKPQPAEGVESIRHAKGRFWQANEMCSEWEPTLWQENCPYGQSGSRLWVREAFRLSEAADPLSPSTYVGDNDREDGIPGRVKYEADGMTVTEAHGIDLPDISWGKKRPSIHMPRELCRLRLRVEDVRVERACDISHNDAIQEGIPDPLRFDKMPKDISEIDLTGDGSAQQLAFKALWERNEWVWVIEFARYDE